MAPPSKTFPPILFNTPTSMTHPPILFNTPIPKTTSVIFNRTTAKSICTRLNSKCHYPMNLNTPLAKESKFSQKRLQPDINNASYH